jgi:type I restriction enzyme M protein
MQDDCYMISNDGWTYPQVRAVKTKVTVDKKTNQQKSKDIDIMYDEIVCDLVPVKTLLAEFFKVETYEIEGLLANCEQTQAAMNDLVEHNTEIFAFNGDEETEDDKELAVKVADVKNAIKKAKSNNTTGEEITILQKWLNYSNHKDALNKSLKEKRSNLTKAVVTKYSTLTEDEIKMLVVERKWLESIISECEALMQNVTHQISNDVTDLAERYETTLLKIEDEVNKIEQQVRLSIAEMGFTI